MYLPDAFLVPGNAGATAHNITTHELLFRIAMVADLVTGALWLLVALALHRLLRRVDETQANLMVILGAFMQVPLYFVNVVNYVAALLLVRGEGYLSGLAIVQREAMSMLFLRLMSAVSGSRRRRSCCGEQPRSLLQSSFVVSVLSLLMAASTSAKCLTVSAEADRQFGPLVTVTKLVEITRRP